jgi:hypothetical protein
MLLALTKHEVSRANGRDMINGVPCVKFNKGTTLGKVLKKAHSMPKRNTSQSNVTNRTDQGTNKMKQPSVTP